MTEFFPRSWIHVTLLTDTNIDERVIIVSELTPAIDRLFRTYYAYCESWTMDSLFNLLTSLHSLDDKLNSQFGRVMFDIPEYIALKALRNYFHHQNEVQNVLRIKHLDGLAAPTDLLYACLVSEDSCREALQGVASKYRNKTEEAFCEVFKVWGRVVDINPCVFNCIVKVFILLADRDLKGASKEYDEFVESFDFEIENGYSHFVTGGFSVRPENVNQLVNSMEQLYNEQI